ncbi:hypothetical protein [Clostridium butyricum]|uniref:hypothetical protein n=1 Tax=Clostridium butyricum TaxID=1492 RepID=UPI00374E74A6
MNKFKNLINMKYAKWILGIVVIVFLVLIIFFKFNISINIIPNEKIVSFISSNNMLSVVDVSANIVYTISALVNIVVVVHFYKKSYTEDNKRVDMQEKLFWFREIVLKKNWENIDLYFNNLSDIKNNLENLKNTSDKASLKDVLNRYTKQKINIQDTFIDFMLFFDGDFSIEIKKILEEFQDKYSNLVKDYIIDDTTNLSEINELVDNHKTKFYKSIYEYERNIICKK